MDTYKKKTHTGDDVRVRIHPPRTGADGVAVPAPTVVLMGWFGAAEKHLAKYGAVFEDVGYNTVQLIAPTSVVFAFGPRNSAAFLLSVIRIVAADNRLTSGGLVFKMFSNGGAILAPRLSQFFEGAWRETLIKADDEPAIKTVRDAMAAVVFESSPCYMHAETGATAVVFGLQVPPGILAGTVRFLFHASAWLQKLLYGDVPARFWGDLLEADYLCPEMYIYSTADMLLDGELLDGLVDYRQRTRKTVARVLRVEDAPHVQIMRAHQEAYITACRSVNDWGVNVFREKKGIPKWTLAEALP